ncbi:response regulator transcription factor [Micromonospora polyrhachis]|uniref:DNA-binding NarL/FixJ family response regulator n=1 Tax=Micromonospora polyrhachis TaxID=1282883 RepID=A0A7W7WM79_9ACTN|nr:response regulator transcription factor [Micromonospora polyrhachis]MBB4956896.1 DNA-binding NarL/FixJ family response regulator [Micromonospora polyrhachis]
MSVIRIGAIDDDRMLLGGLRSWLAPITDVDLVLVSTTVAGYLTEVDPAAVPQVVLLDLNLRDNSVPAENVARVLATGAQVLVVSTIPDADGVLATIEAGASGYVTKDQDLEVLVQAIRDVVAGGLVVSPELAFVLSRDSRPHRPRLSAQERAVLTAYASGATLAAAARRAGVAYGTAREYLERVKRKYAEAGRPAHTKLDLADRVREDRLELHGLGEPGS